MSKKYNPTTIKRLRSDKNIIKDINLILNDIDTNFRLIASSINQNAQSLTQVATGCCVFGACGPVRA